MKKRTEGRRRETAAKVAALTLANAFIFQEQLSAVEHRAQPLRKILASSDIIGSFEEHWNFICSTINYVPIFRIAREILLTLPSGSNSDEAVKQLARRALIICSEKAALRHDLMGRVYHWLLHDAKYLGTYYTSVPAATLLLKLALSTDRWSVHWEDVNALKDFKVADLACGTETLLMAASQALTDNFIRCSAQAAQAVDDDALRELHRTLMESVIHGYDVLPSAIHLTASTLALLAPEIAFRKMQLYSLPLGKLARNIHLGSIDYLGSKIVQTQFDLMGHGHSEVASAITGKGLVASEAPLPDLDLCVMNPPFVRSVGGNLLFGSMPEPDRAAMQKELRRIMRAKDGEQVLANTNAGLGSVFTAIADRHLKVGGSLALVLPAAVTTGVSWRATRALIQQGYDLELVVTSHEADRWNFSENTDLSEVLVVARKKQATEGNLRTVFANLWHNPRTSAEALAVAEAISRCEPARIGTPSSPDFDVRSLFAGERRVGEVLAIPLDGLTPETWIGGAFAQTDLVRAACYLREGTLWTPGSSQFKTVAVAPLKKIVTLGLDRRRLWATFKRTDRPPGTSVLWGHNASEMTTVASAPNAYLIKLEKTKEPQKEGYAESLVTQAGQIMIAERMWLVTQRVTAVMLPTEALSNVWWPAKLKLAGDSLRTQLLLSKALVLWLNSSLGALLMLAHRVPTRGPWISFKKPALEEVPVLDISSLRNSELDALAETFDEVAKQELQPFAEIGTDGNRAIIDAALARVLGVSSLRPFAEMLGREPILTNIPLLPQALTGEGEPVQEQLSLF